MTLKPRYFTKSLFALACKCPTKLYYTNKQDEYLNTKLEDPFLKGLAEGGLQVAALAKQYYPEGKEIESFDYHEAWLKNIQAARAREHRHMQDSPEI